MVYSLRGTSDAVPNFFCDCGTACSGADSYGAWRYCEYRIRLCFYRRFWLGMAGAAVATGIGYSVPALFGLAWFAVSRRGTLYFVRPVWRGKVLLKALGNGSSEMVTYLSEAVVTFLFNMTMLRYLGADGVAAITIVLYTDALLVEYVSWVWNWRRACFKL